MDPSWVTTCVVPQGRSAKALELPQGDNPKRPAIWENPETDQGITKIIKKYWHVLLIYMDCMILIDSVCADVNSE